MNVELDVEKRLQALVVRDRVRIKEFFIDFDKLRKGWVGEAAFRTCLGTLNLKFSKVEIDALVNKYKIGNSGLVNYAQLCDNINFVFSDLANPVGVIENSKSTANFTDTEKETILALIGAIKE